MQVSTSEVLAVLAEVLEESADSLTSDRKLDSIDAWDSVGVLTLMAELDDKYGLTLTTDEIQNFSTIKDVLTVLRDKGLNLTD